MEDEPEGTHFFLQGDRAECERLFIIIANLYEKADKEEDAFTDLTLELGQGDEN